MRIKENHSIIIDKYPFASRLNSRLLSDAEGIDYSLSFKTNVKARMSDWRVKENDSFKVLQKWIISLIQSKYDFPGYEIVFQDMWYARYDKNNYTQKHDHYLGWQSFVYFVKCPRGSSPLIFTTSGKRIKAEEGKVVIFPSTIWHSVPKNRCDDRVVVAGNTMLLSMPMIRRWSAQ